MTESKGLIEHTGQSCNQIGRSDWWRVTSGEQEDPDLLIRQGLSARQPVERGKRLLNLKDLLTILPTIPKRVFENGSVLEPLFLVQNRTKFRHFLPKHAEYGMESTFFAIDFMERAKSYGSEHLNECRPQTGRRRRPPKRPTHLPASGRKISRAGRRLVTGMVKLRKLIQGDNRNFPLWKSDFGDEAVLQTNGLSDQVSVFGRFGGYQIVPNFTNFYQKRAANRLEQGDKGGA